MLRQIQEEVSVWLYFDHLKRKVSPYKVLWSNREYLIQKIGLHHSFRIGRTLYHVYSVTTETLFLRLVLNTENLQWTLEHVSDGLPG